MKTVLLLSAILAAVLVFMLVKNARTPSHLGITNGELAPVPKTPNGVSSQTNDPDKLVAPFPFKGDLDKTKALIKQALQAYGNMIIRSETDDYIHAVNTTPVLRFKDDLEFYFLNDERIVHVRSASRIGYSDLGLNKRRYTRLMEIYNDR